MNRRSLTTKSWDRHWAFWAGYYSALRMAAMSDARTASHIDVRCIHIASARKWNRELLRVIRELKQVAA